MRPETSANGRSLPIHSTCGRDMRWLTSTRTPTITSARSRSWKPRSAWEGQDALALHLWWHLALRYLAVGRRDEALALYDTQRENATTLFRLCDMTSLLWRLDLLGHDTGDRWDVLADRWAGVAERHTCGFGSPCCATFIRRPDHHGADVWSRSAARPNRGAEIDDIFESVTKPLVAALRAADPDALDKLTPSLHRIGGSNAQRRIISLTAGAWR